MRLFGSSVGIVLSVLLSFSSGGLLFLYWRTSSTLQLLQSENKQLKRELLNVHNDKHSEQYNLRRARSDLDDALLSVTQLQNDISDKDNELHELGTHYNATKKKLAKLKQDTEQNQLELSNLRVNKEVMYKELDAAKEKIAECDDYKSKVKESQKGKVIHYSPRSPNNNNRPIGMLQPDDMDTHKIINPYNSVRHSQQVTPAPLGEYAVPKVILRDRSQQSNNNPRAIQLNRRDPKTHSLNQESPPHNLAKPRVDQANPRANRINPQVDQANPRVDRIKPQVDQANPRVDRIKPQVDQANPRVDRIKPQVNEELQQKRIEQQLRVNDR